MALQCPRCGAAIPAQNINIQETLAVCSHCDHVFHFHNTIPTRKSEQRKVQQPGRLRVHEEENSLELSYRAPLDKGLLAGLTFQAIFLLIFAVVAPILGHSLNWHGFPGLPAALGLSVVWLGMSVAIWYSIVYLLTKTTRIRIDAETLAVNTGPLPSPLKGNQSLSRAEVTEIFCEETEWSKKRAALDRYYQVYAHLADGNRVALIESLPQDFAFYITQELSAALPPEENVEVVPPGDEFYADSSQEIAAPSSAPWLAADEEANATVSER